MVQINLAAPATPASDAELCQHCGNPDSWCGCGERTTEDDAREEAWFAEREAERERIASRGFDDDDD